MYIYIYIYIHTVYTVSLYTYLTHTEVDTLCRKVDACSSNQEIPYIYGTRKFMTVLTTARYCITLQANLIQFTQSHSTSMQCVPVSIFDLFSDLINISFPCHFLAKDVCVCVCVCVHFPSPNASYLSYN